MRNAKKMLCIAAALFHMVTAVPLMAAADTGSDLLLVLSYENGLAPVGKIQDSGGSYITASVDSEHPQSIKVSKPADKSSGGVYFFTASSLACKATLISLDCYFDSVNLRSYFQLFDSNITDVENAGTGDYYGTIQMNHRGEMMYFADMLAGGNSQYTIMPKINQWYHIDMWADYHSQQMIYYIDGKLFGKVPLPAGLDKIGGFRYLVASGNGEAHYLDNVKMYHFPKRGFQINLPGITVPEDFMVPVIICPDTAKNNLGYIYFDKNIDMYVSFDNVTEETKNTEITYAVYNEKNELLLEKHMDAEMLPDSSVEKTLSVSVGEFGFYQMEITVTENNQVISSKRQEFSVANTPHDGVKNEWVGLCDHTDASVSGNGAAEAERKIKLFSDAGFSDIRQEYYWKAFETAEGNLAVPSGTQQMVQLAERNGMGILGILMGTPAHIQADSMAPPTTPEELQNWTNYVAYVGEQTKDITEYYEVWNEYNVPSFNTINATPQDYVNLLKATKDGLNQGYPEGKVCGFAVANVGPDEGYDMSALAWMEEVLKLGGGEYMDAASIHGYTHVRPEGTNSSRSWLIDETRELLDRYGYTDMPIIMTEMGWSSTDEVLQAKYMIRYSAMRYKSVDKLYWYVSQEKEKVNEAENRFGIIRAWDEAAAQPHAPYAAKPAFLALSNFNALLANAEPLGKVNMENEQVYNYKFIDRNGKTVNVVWSAVDTTVEIQTPQQETVVYDIYGNDYPFNKTANGVSVNLTDSPVYILEESSPIEVYTDYNTGIVTVTGSSRVSNTLAGITVIKSNDDVAAPKDIAFIGQTTTNSYGRYMFSFKNLNRTGDYVIRVGFDGGLHSTDIQLTVNIPELVLTDETQTAIEHMSQLVAGDILKAELSGSYLLTKDRNTLLVIAQYGGGRLLDTAVCHVGKNEIGATVSTTVLEGTENIKVMFWDNSLQMPLIGSYEVK